MAREITACICTCDRYDLLDAALASLAEQSLPRRRYDICVVDTTRDERRVRGLGRRLRGDAVRYLTAPGKGLSEARNAALERCRTPVIAYLDDDALADVGWLAALRERFGRIERLGALGGPVRPIWEAPPPAWLPESLRGYLSIVDWGPDERELAAHEWLAGTNIAYRVAAARTAGGFRPHLGRQGRILLGNEEIDLCRRVVRNGWRVVYAPAAAVRHRVAEGRLRQQWLRQRVAWQAISDLMTEPFPEFARDELLAAIDAYFGRLASADRDPQALFREAGDAAMFEAQCNAVRAYVLLLGGDAA